MLETDIGHFTCSNCLVPWNQNCVVAGALHVQTNKDIEISFILDPAAHQAKDQWKYQDLSLTFGFPSWS